MRSFAFVAGFALALTAATFAAPEAAALCRHPGGAPDDVQAGPAWVTFWDGEAPCAGVCLDSEPDCPRESAAEASSANAPVCIPRNARVQVCEENGCYWIEVNGHAVTRRICL